MSEQLWTAYEAAAATGGALCARGGDPDRWVAEEWSAGGVSIDTRTLNNGDIFVALEDVRDGHDFLSSAFKGGASAALVSRAPEDVPEGAPLLVVPDTLDGLRALARAARYRNFGKRVGITGSVGKTSVKEMMRTALAGYGQVHAADRSFNNHWGVPLTLASLPMHADYGVFEIGMNHAGEITPLTQLVAPHVAVITTVAPAHLAHFKNVEAIAEAKAEIFTGVSAGGAAVLPADNPHFALLQERAREAGIERILTFGTEQSADFCLLGTQSDAQGQRIQARLCGEEHSFQLGAAGSHQALNALAVLATIDALGLSLPVAMDALQGFQAGAGRGEQRVLSLGERQVALIDESYNANPASMAASIALLGNAVPRAGGRRVAVLGDMLELGENAPAFHADLLPALKAAKVERLFALGTLMEALFDKAPAAMCGGIAQDPQEIVTLLLKELRDGDTILVKGSNASRVSQVITLLEKAGETG